MRKMLKALLGLGSGSSPLHAPDVDDIPRYPPFAKGLPAANVDRVLLTQQELIGRIKHTLALSADDFDHLIMPVIRNYAAYVHLLPASEMHHHRGAGGLFRHGLEVAFWATQSSEGIIFTYGSSPRAKKEQEPRWRVATCLAGLLHDIGKPAADLSVTSPDGQTTWNPYGETLTGWAATNRIDRYFLRWRDGRHKRHEQFSILVMDKIVMPETLTWLTQPGPEILQSMLTAISGGNPDHVVSNLVMRADSTSVARDMKSHNIVQTDGSLGVPVEKYLLDAIRRLIASSDWLINQRGARVWVLHDGPYIVWRQGAEDIVRLLASDRIPGIPRDPDTLADILIDRNLAVPQKLDNATSRYWDIAPDALVQEDGSRVRLPMLKLISNEAIFSGEPPPPTGAIVESIAKMNPANAGTEDSTQVPAPTDSETNPTKPSGKSGVSSVDNFTTDELPRVEKTSLSPADPSNQPHKQVHAPQVASPRPEKDKGSDVTNPPHKGPSKAKSSVDIVKPSSPAPSVEDWLADLPGDPGTAFRSVVATLKSKPDLWQKALDEFNGTVVIRYPDGAAAFEEPPALLKALDKGGLLDLDPAAPMKKVRTIGALKGLILTPAASRALLSTRCTDKGLTRGDENCTLRQSAIPLKPIVDDDQPTKVPEQKATKQHASPKNNKQAQKSAVIPAAPKRSNVRTRKKVTPSDGATHVAQKMISDIRSGTILASIQALRVDGALVVPLTVIGAYGRAENVSRWELREAVSQLPGCLLQNEKLYVTEG